MEQGFRAFGRLMISGPDALQARRARYAAEVFWESAGGTRPLRRHAHAVPRCSTPATPRSPAAKPGEILLQVAARDDDRRKAGQRLRAATRAQGALDGARHHLPLRPGAPAPERRRRLLARAHRSRRGGARARWRSDGRARRGGAHAQPLRGRHATFVPIRLLADRTPHCLEGSATKVRLRALRGSASRAAATRATPANIGVIARSPDDLPLDASSTLSAGTFVKEHFAGRSATEDVERFEVPNHPRAQLPAPPIAGGRRNALAAASMRRARPTRSTS